jgi:hypothetical protein
MRDAIESVIFGLVTAIFVAVPLYAMVLVVVIIREVIQFCRGEK